jgi:deoxyribonucleoside regulator
VPPKKAVSMSRGQPFVDDIILEAAWLYYYEERNQNEIAEALGVSRSSVVGYLQHARERGIVEVRLDPSSFARHRYARELKERYGLIDVQIAPGDGFSLDRVAILAARCLPDLVVAGDTLGVAWGQTVFTLSEHIVPRLIPELTVVQMVGAMSSPYGFDTESCASQIAASLGGRCVNLHVPAIVSSHAMAVAIQQEAIIASQLEELTHINKVLFAAGSCNADSHIVSSGIASLDDLAEYQRNGAVGVVCGRFIDNRGQHIKGHLDDRLIGVTPDRVRGLETGILVSCGPDKIEAIHAALLGGYATHLFTDMPTAAGILRLNQ